MKGDPAHGGPFFQSAVLAGKRKLQLLRSRQGVVEKHLVKIAKTVKEDRIAVLFFCFQIFLHHW